MRLNFDSKYVNLADVDLESKDDPWAGHLNDRESSRRLPFSKRPVSVSKQMSKPLLRDESSENDRTRDDKRAEGEEAGRDSPQDRYPSRTKDKSMTRSKRAGEIVVKNNRRDDVDIEEVMRKSIDIIGNARVSLAYDEFLEFCGKGKGKESKQSKFNIVKKILVSMRK